MTEPRQMRALPLGGGAHGFVGNLTDEQAAKLDRRMEAVRVICAERGWDPDAPGGLSLEQVLEVRKDQRWLAA